MFRILVARVNAIIGEVCQNRTSFQTNTNCQYLTNPSHLHDEVSPFDFIVESQVEVVTVE